MPNTVVTSALQGGGAGGGGLELVEAGGEVGAVDVVGPHDDRVLERAVDRVVPLADPGGGEAEAAVEGLGGLVGRPHLEGEGGGALVHRGPAQGEQQAL